MFQQTLACEANKWSNLKRIIIFFSNSSVIGQFLTSYYIYYRPGLCENIVDAASIIKY